MEVIVLAGGFATRMGALTKDTPKQLLPLGNKTIIDYVLKSIEPLNPTQTFISTNSKFVKHFDEFIENYNGPLSLELIEEEALAESEKRGALSSIGDIIVNRKSKGPLFVVGGDNVSDFDLSKMTVHFEKYQNDTLALYDVQDISLAKLYGIVTLDGFKITSLKEKPATPSSTLASTALWLLSEAGQESLINYLGFGFEKDSMGAFMEYHCTHSNVDGIIYNTSWFDIGSPEAYQAAIEWTNSEGNLS
tara:strand:- start:269 stop:1012 length:744 start_codon:yes stop_codon:yes gene_type:complete